MVELNYKEMSKDSTGEHGGVDFQIITVPFDRYAVRLKLDSNNRFMEIVEIQHSKQFLNQVEHLAAISHHEVEEFYKDDDK